MKESRLKIFFGLMASVIWSLIVEIYDQLKSPFASKDKTLNLLKMRAWLNIPIDEDKDRTKARKRK